MKSVLLILLVSVGSLARAETNVLNANSANLTCSQVLSEKIRSLLQASFGQVGAANPGGGTQAARELAQKYDHLMSKIERNTTDTPSLK